MIEYRSELTVPPALFRLMRCFILKRPPTPDLVSRLPKTPDDWHPLLVAAEHHRSVPFLGLVLNAEPSLEPMTAGRLRAAVHDAALQNVSKAHEFERVSELFRAGGIEIAPLKGIAFNFLIYQDWRVRIIGDFDLVVRQGDVSRAVDLLTRNGFRAKISTNPWQDRLGTRVLGRCSYLKGNVDVDLQWSPRLFVAGHLIEWDAAAAWNRSTKQDGIRLFAPADHACHQLLEICDNIERKELLMQKWVDLALLMKSYGVKREEVLGPVIGDYAPASRAALEENLSLVEEIFLSEKEPSDALLEEAGRLARPAVRDQFFAGRLELSSPILSPAEKLLFLLGYFFPAPEYLRLQYGPGPANLVTGWLRHYARLLRKIAGFLSSFPGRR